MKELAFEEALKRLERIVEDLESEEISLEASLKKYEEGISLIKQCHKKIEEARKKIEVLIKKEGGKLELKGFDESAAKEDD